ncbi:MAG: hypothetical protein M0Z79_03580 [Nitrospiraceae bacterium]|nr:hypothetical protein [Nitrospiraceae bacterium]
MRTLSISALLMLLLFAPSAFGFSNKGEDCSKCHTLTKDEAAAILKEIIPNPKIVDVRIAPSRAMWEVAVESNGKKAPLYLDFSKKYLFSGNLVDIKARKNLTEERFTDLNRVDVGKIPLKDALVMGDRQAKHKVIVFDDPD